jgi:hypothetical protein
MKLKTNRKEKTMEYKFNGDQIELIKDLLINQEEICSKSKSNRQYYDADLRRLNECLKIITTNRYE